MLELGVLPGCCSVWRECRYAIAGTHFAETESGAELGAVFGLVGGEADGFLGRADHQTSSPSMLFSCCFSTALSAACVAWSYFSARNADTVAVTTSTSVRTPPSSLRRSCWSSRSALICSC